MSVTSLRSERGRRGGRRPWQNQGQCAGDLAMASETATLYGGCRGRRPAPGPFAAAPTGGCTIGRPTPFAAPRARPGRRRAPRPDGQRRGPRHGQLGVAPPPPPPTMRAAAETSSGASDRVALCYRRHQCDLARFGAAAEHDGLERRARTHGRRRAHAVVGAQAVPAANHCAIGRAPRLWRPPLRPGRPGGRS